MVLKSTLKDSLKGKQSSPQDTSVFDRYRFLSEYGDSIGDLTNSYKPNMKPNNVKLLENRVGMTRALDFTPSTDLGQNYFNYKYKQAEGGRESDNIGYAPAYLQVAHLNSPSAYKDLQKKTLNYDVVQGTFRTGNIK